MKNLKLYSFFFPLTVILLIFTFIWYRYEFKNEIEKKNIDLAIVSTKLTEFRNKYLTLSEHQNLSIKISHKKVKIDLKKNLIEFDDYLILRVHENDCNDCFKLSLKLLEKHKIKNVLILADFKNLDTFETTFGSVNHKVLIVNSLSTDLENVTKPYVFKLLKNGSTMDYTFPNYQFIELFDEYLKITK
jgi:preprotein translocase subunit YajC